MNEQRRKELVIETVKNGPSVLNSESLLKYLDAFSTKLLSESSAEKTPVNEMFHIQGGRLVKTSNGQPIPEDEPTFILRGRDTLAVETIRYYRQKAELAGCLPAFLSSLHEVFTRFFRYRDEHPITMKQPGVTGGR